MDLPSIKLERLFNPNMMGIIKICQLQDGLFDYKEYSKFKDDVYYLQNSKSSIIFGYIRYNIWNDKSYRQPIALFIKNDEMLIFPEFINYYSRDKFDSDYKIFSFSGKDQLLIEIFSLDVFHEIKMNMKNFKNGHKVIFETLSGTKFYISYVLDYTLDIFIEGSDEHIGFYENNMSEIGFTENYRLRGEKLKNDGLLSAFNIVR